MAPNLNNPYRVAATLIYQYGLTLEDAFIGAWKWNYPDKPIPESYYTVLRRVKSFKPENHTPVPPEIKDVLIELRRGEEPWLKRWDPTYCRVCYRAPIWRRLRCQHCIRRGGWSDPLPCGVPGCNRPILAKGRCRTHYQQAWRAGTLWKPANLHFVPLSTLDYIRFATDD